MNPILRITVLLPFLVITIPNKISAQNCEGLIHFRDVEMYEQYNKAFEKYELNQHAIKEMQKIRKETLGEREWNKLMSTETAISDGGVATAIIAQNIKITCTLISDLLKFNPAVGIVGVAVEKSILSAERIYETIKFGKSLASVVDDGAEKTAYKELLSKGGAVGQAVKTAWNFSEETAKMTAIPKDRDKLKSEVTRILDMIDNAVAKYQQALDKSSLRLTEVNNIKIGIDKYLLEHCKDVTQKNDAKFSTRESDNNKANTSIAKDTKVVGNAFFIFLTTNLSVSGKSMTIISPPILHNGNLTDDMVEYKKDFIKQVERQLPNKPENFRQSLEMDNYETISVQYARPYSTSLLKSENESLSAIDAFRQSIKDAVDGLPNAYLVDFFQLK